MTQKLLRHTALLYFLVLCKSDGNVDSEFFLSSVATSDSSSKVRAVHSVSKKGVSNGVSNRRQKEFP